MRLSFVLVMSILFCFPCLSSGQKPGKKIIITGKVTDAGNKPVPAATIFIDKKKTANVTDENGLFRVKVKPDAREILVLSLLNGAKEELINGRTEIDIILTGISSGNPENKVNDRKNETKASGTLDMRNSGIPVYQDIYDMIRGRVAGVEVSGKSIRIRGINSLNVNTEPLFVVDGVIVKTIDDIAPETVKSIGVLKGPDATAYGTRGSNGVILITRRKGIE